MTDTSEGKSPLHDDVTARRCPACGQVLMCDEQRQRKKFVWGTVLASLLLVIFLIGFRSMFSAISSQKTTGLGAVAGGLSEMAVTAGLVMTFCAPIAAIFLLSRTFHKGHGLRSFFSVLGILWSAMFLLFVAALVVGFGIARVQVH